MHSLKYSLSEIVTDGNCDAALLQCCNAGGGDGEGCVVSESLLCW